MADLRMTAAAEWFVQSSLMIRAGLVLLLLAAAVPAQAHSWYTGLRNRNGISCCEDRTDPVGLCVLPDRREGLLIEGAAGRSPWDKVLDLPRPTAAPTPAGSASASRRPSGA